MTYISLLLYAVRFVLSRVFLTKVKIKKSQVVFLQFEKIRRVKRDFLAFLDALKTKLRINIDFNIFI